MSFPKISLQNHTCFSGGQDTPEEMVLAAIDAGLQTIGFPVHACTSFDLQPWMNPEISFQYRTEILHLAEKYREKIEILIGEARDFYADPVFHSCDYSIGSVGYVVADDGAICRLQGTVSELTEIVKAHFGGNFYKLTNRYYETLAKLYNRTKCNWVFNFDGIRFLNLQNNLFDEDSIAYRGAVLNAMEALVREPLIFEIRQIDVPKSGKPVFSPAPDIVRWLVEHGANFIISSNAFCKDDLLAGTEACVRFAKSCGVSGITVPAQGEWKTIPL